MKTILPISLLFLLFVLSSSCSKTKSDISLALDKADSISQTQPIIAEHIIDSISIKTNFFSNEEKNRWKLLRIKINDKLDKLDPLKSLEILDTLENYFTDKFPGSLLQAETYYYKGRSYSEINDSPSALYFLDKALLTINGNAAYDKLESAILSQMSFLYFKQGYINKAIELDKKSLMKAYESKDTSEIIYSEMGIASTYISAELLDMAVPCIDRALSKAKEINDSAMVKYISVQKGLLYIRQGYIEKADSIWQTVKSLKESPNDEEYIKHFQASLSILKGDSIEANKIYEWLSVHGNPLRKVNAHKFLFNYFSNKGDIDKMIIHGNSAINLYDSIREINHNIPMKDVETDNLLHRHSIEMNKIEEKARFRGVMIIILAVFSLALVSAVVILILKNRHHDNSFSEISDDNKSENILEASNANGQDDYVGTVARIKNLVRNQAHLPESEWHNLELVSFSKFPDLSKFATDNNLTEYELRIILLIILGYKNKEISEILHKNPNTVASARTRMEQKYFNPEGSAKDLDLHIRSIIGL